MDETVDVVDVQTGNLQRYGQRQTFDPGLGTRLAWISRIQVVALSIRKDGIPSLGLDMGNGQQSMLVDKLGSSYWALSPDGSNIIYMPGGTTAVPHVIDVISRTVQALPFSLPTQPGQNAFIDYQMAWNPTAPLVVSQLGGLPDNLDTGSVCRLTWTSARRQPLGNRCDGVPMAAIGPVNYGGSHAVVYQPDYH
jgi:hypothetical protein